MELSPSGHTDTFARDRLPPAEQWPMLEFTTEEIRYPQSLNAATELIDVPTATFGPDRPALRTPDGEVWTDGELQRRVDRIAQVLTEDLGLVPGNRVLLRSPNNPWVAGPEVEAAVDTRPDVVETAVVAAPDPERGSIVCAFVVLREGVAGDAGKAKEIQDHVKQQIAPYKYPRTVRFTDSLPRNTSGKLQHFKLRQQVEAQA